MKKKVLFSTSLFHAANDAATVTMPMIFPLLYTQQYIIRKYWHIGILSYVGLFTTMLFQIIIANSAHRYEYKKILLFSMAGISATLVLITFSWNFASMLLLYLTMRMFMSFYHPVGIAMVSTSHPNQGLDFAMGIQSGSGNLGVLTAFITTGYLAQSLNWQVPLYVWATMCLLIGFYSFSSLRKMPTQSFDVVKPDFSHWREALNAIKKHVPGFVFGGACWGTTVYYAPSLLNHRYGIPLGTTGVYLACWIGIGTVMTYLFGLISQRFGRGKVARAAIMGATLFLFLLWKAPSRELAVVFLLFFGSFLFLLFPAFQSSVGNQTPQSVQTLAFSIVANVKMLFGALAGLIAGFLSDSFGINSPFLFLALCGVCVSVYYLRGRSQ
ncbi:MAG: MFS transporter [Candidatus Aminicenantes bacterium]|jgi:MFS family permease